jgi:hypothetical protein
MATGDLSEEETKGAGIIVLSSPMASVLALESTLLACSTYLT